MTCTAPGTAATRARLHFKLDNKNRYTSGGTELTAKSTSYEVSDNYADRVPKAKVYFGDLTASDESSAKPICTVLLRNNTQAAPCFTEDDTFFMSYDSINGFAQDGAASPVVNATFKIPFINIGPQSSLIVHPLFEAQTAASSFEIEVGLIEFN